MKHATLAATSLAIVFATAANADKITTMQCGHISNPITHENVKVIEDLYHPRVSMNGGTHSFETWHRNDNKDESIVVSQYANGQIYVAPIPPELNPFN